MFELDEYDVHEEEDFFDSFRRRKDPYPVDVTRSYVRGGDIVWEISQKGEAWTQYCPVDYENEEV